MPGDGEGNSHTIQQTRKQAAEQDEKQRLDDIATAQSGATLVDLSEVLDLDDSLFQKEEQRQVQATPDAEEDVLQFSLPETVAEDPVEEGDDRTLLMEQQKKDELLAMVTKMADRNENGYKYEEGLVVHIKMDELGTAWTRVEMPKCRCRSILALAHSNPMGDHFGVKRTTARVRNISPGQALMWTLRAFVHHAHSAKRLLGMTTAGPHWYPYQ